LNFTCTCENGTTPDVSLYQNTIPFFVCQENYIQCVNNHPNDLQGQEYCKGNATCGTLNATATQTTTTTSAASTTAASTGAPSSGSSSSHSSAAAAATSTAAAIALQMAQDHSTSLLTAVLLAVFGVIL
jgi:activator of HSP90 ATPase